MEKSLDQYSSEELEQMLAKRKQSEKQKKEKARKAYEAERDQKITRLMAWAKKLSEELTKFKAECHDVMEDQAKKLEEYGGIRGNSKGGFSITHSDGSVRITRRRDTSPYWDERASKGIQLVKEFLHDTVKKRDIELFEILISFLERNKEGELEYNRVMGLLRHENKFSDKRWIEGLHLIKEGYVVMMKGYAYEFKTHRGDGKWHHLTLNFSAI